MKKTKEPVWPVGTMLLLKEPKGVVGNPGLTVAVVVDGRQEYPRLFAEMVSRVGYKTLENDFVCVDWPINSGVPKGYYSLHRFAKMKLQRGADC